MPGGHKPQSYAMYALLRTLEFSAVTFAMISSTMFKGWCGEQFLVEPALAFEKTRVRPSGLEGPHLVRLSTLSTILHILETDRVLTAFSHRSRVTSRVTLVCMRSVPLGPQFAIECHLYSLRSLHAS